MIQKRTFALVAIGAAILFASCSDDFPSISAKAPAKEFFQATLTPASEVPPVTGVSSSGLANITILDTNLIRVETQVSTIDSVTQAHIHAGDANVAGPVMVFLLPFVAAGRAPITGTDRALSLVDISRTTVFQTGWNFDSLMFRIHNGTAYVNVHTRKNGGGEIRGQIVPKP